MKKTTLLLFLALTGCQDDFLEKQPIDQFTDEAVWSDPKLVVPFVNSKYNSIGWGFDEVLWASLSDEAMFKHDYGTHLVNRGEVGPSNLGITNSWTKNYGYIRDVNLFFERIDDVPMDEALKKRLMGEMKFIRAFRYFDLIRNYGEVPLITKTFGLNDDFTQVRRAPLAEGTAFVVKEADEAAALLPLAYEGADVGRATRGAALALKARMLLYAASPLYSPSRDAAKWQQAADAAKAVLDLGQYQLYPNYQELFLTPHNAEVIFERARVAVGDGWVHLELSNGPNGYGGWGGNMPLQNLVDAYQTSTGKNITDPTSGYNPQNPYLNRDPRFYATILYNGAKYKDRAVETFVPGGKDSQDGPEEWNTSITGYYLRKFMNERKQLKDFSNGSTTHWIHFRLGEVLLNYAEARNEASGPDATVYDAVNQIRARVSMPTLPAGLSQAQMREAIRRERQVELAFEEHRYYDVRRWQIAGQTESQPARGIIVTKNPDGTLKHEVTTVQERRFADRNYWLPIPFKETQANPALKQNPGW